LESGSNTCSTSPRGKAAEQSVALDRAGITVSRHHVARQPARQVNAVVTPPSLTTRDDRLSKTLHRRDEGEAFVA
jgi:hypothetical protein